MKHYLETEVAGRAHHSKPEDVRTTCSFARAERLLGREYHGRFLIELLQNAADASRNSDESSTGSRVAVKITDGPALLVANEGTPMSAEVVIESLGHIGASTKPEGEAIGHKGIGFKSVLELTLTPEIYSGLQETSPTLSVGFDPERAKETILDSSPGWKDMVAGVQGLDSSDPFAAIPVLRFPYWIDELPADVASLKRDGFNTVVRLPFNGSFAGRLGFNSASWLANVREHLDDVSDEILLLLGSFEEVVIEDRLAGSEEVIRPKWEQAPVEISEEVTREVVRVERNGRLSSRWRLFRRTLPDRHHLSGEVAVGIQVSDGADAETVLSAVEDQPSSPFHLFFPTRIPSGAPFLLHAYFQVDAPRTGFYQGSAERNQALLEELAKVTKIAVADASKVEGLELVSLVDLVAQAGEPEDPLARNFRANLLDLLGEVPWIPLEEGEEGPQAERPGAMFGALPELLRLTGRVFPAPYIRWRTGLGLPSGRLSDAAIELVRSRLPSDAPGTWETIGLLCRPGEYPLWAGEEADHAFVSLLDLLSRLEAENRRATQELLASLRGDPESRLIPAVGAESSRNLLPVPDPSEATPGQRSQLVMARIRSSVGQNLVPPAELDVAFLPDGLLASEAELDRAKPLGVRPFTVDSILDRLNGIENIEKAAVSGEALVRFLWRLLTRDRVSVFLQQESDAEREEFLLELGITNEEVDAIRTRIGVVGEAERQRHGRWFAAVLGALRSPSAHDDPHAGDLAHRLQSAGLTTTTATRLVELGGGEAVRRDSGPDSPLWLLNEAEVDLKDLQLRLLEADDSGLNIKDAQRAFTGWIGTHGRRLSTVLAMSMHPDEAKAKVRSLQAPHDLRLSIDPALEALLSPVVAALGAHGMNTDGVSLAHDAATTLAELGGFGSVEELDARVPVIFDQEERESFLRGRANQWQREIQLLAVVARTGPAEPRARIREIDQDVTAIIPPNPAAPTELRDCLGELFGNHPKLASRAGEPLEDGMNAAAPNREQLMAWAREDGVAVDRLPAVLKSLEQPRREHVRKLAERAQLLAKKEVRPVAPPALQILSPPQEVPPGEVQDDDKDPDTGPRRVPAIKVDEKLDRRKRELGDEGEQWTLATVVSDLMRLDEESWNAAIEDIVRLLGRFEGTPVDRALAHATRARERGLDEEERVDELSGLLHVSRYSDAFGFDLIGWLPSDSGAGRAVCLEVKSSGSSGFHLSGGEWSLAEQLYREGVGDQYAVLVVRRAKTGGVPEGMDLLRDPTSLVKTGFLRREVDGYRLAYQAGNSNGHVPEIDRA